MIFDQILRWVFLVTCSVCVTGILFNHCRVKQKIRCGSPSISFFECRKLRCCYGTTFFGRSYCYHSTSSLGFRPPNVPSVHGMNTARTTASTTASLMMSTTVTPAPQRVPNRQPLRAICLKKVQRIDCGFPGINRYECQQKGCCWDDRFLGLSWCFKPTLVGYQPPNAGPNPTYPTLISSDNNPFHRHVNNEETLPPTTTLLPSLTEPGRVYSETQLKFLRKLNQEITQLKENSSVFSSAPPTTYSTKTVMSPHHQSFFQQLLERIKPTTTTTISTTPTTAPTPLKANNLLLSLLVSQGNPPAGDDSQRGSLFQNIMAGGQGGSVYQLIAYLRLMQKLNHQQKPTAPIVTSLQACEAAETDTFCRSDPTAPCCGFDPKKRLFDRLSPQARIVGGTAAGDLRRSVAHIARRTDRAHLCGGTLVNPEWVLTAAHCVLNYCDNSRATPDLIISLGKYRKSPYFFDAGQQDFMVNKVVCHHNQRLSAGQPRFNDVALIRLTRPALLTSKVQMAPMPQPFEQPAPNLNCVALGWGSTKGTGFNDVLKEVSVPSFTNNQCAHPDWRGCLVRSCMLCAGDINADPCDGDSGGPLFCPRAPGLYVLHGVYSWGRCGTEAKKPSIYTRASYFITWMNEIIAAHRFSSSFRI